MDLEQRRRNDQIIGGLLALIPDALIGFAVMKLHDDQWSTFWWTIVALQGVYFFFWLKKKVWESVVWHAWARERQTATFLEILKRMKMPAPEPYETDAEIFFGRVKEDESETVRDTHRRG